MKLSYLELSGFRGYRRRLRIDFADHFTIIDGRNGVGKSSIFDAVEYALTGALSKYDVEKAAGETASDYVWWRGKGDVPEERFVEVGFKDGEEEISITRREFEGPDPQLLERLISRLCEPSQAPAEPLKQLCTNAIIRDEHITKLSLDLKETDRYGLLRNALGASDANIWIERGQRLLSQAKNRTSSIQRDLTEANAHLAAAARRLDEVRASALSESAIKEVVERLRDFVGSDVEPERLGESVREQLSLKLEELAALRMLADEWAATETERRNLPELKAAYDIAKSEQQKFIDELQALDSENRPVSASELEESARSLFTLATIGRQLGLHDGSCPLCAKGQTHEEFAHGVELAENLAREMSANAENASRQEQARSTTEAKLADANRRAEKAEARLSRAQSEVENFDRRRQAHGTLEATTIDQLSERAGNLRQALDIVQADLQKLETFRSGGQLERAQRDVTIAKNRLAQLQEKGSRARKTVQSSQSLFYAASRAASETLDQRLERVLPLMSELYRRLRPHPIWNDIEYSIRGDVRRFMTLRVGEELNPQFLFSSGQRRATGLAFLLSVNLSLAWSKWRTVLLDDPVQHIDDFRAVHLAELAGQLVKEGRQVVCAVEDSALAELFARRLPLDGTGSGKRITLGPDSSGDLVILHEQSISPLLRNSLTISGDTAHQIG